MNPLQRQGMRLCLMLGGFLCLAYGVSALYGRDVSLIVCGSVLFAVNLFAMWR